MIQLTEAAAAALHLAIATTPKSIAGLRLMAQSCGCSGFQYEMVLVEDVEGDDISCESRGVKILIDPSSMELLSGTIIDYVDCSEASGFAFNNPQAKRKSNCGKSCC